MPRRNDERDYVVYGLVETRAGHRFEGMIRYVGQTCELQSRIAGYRAGRGNNIYMTRWLVRCLDFQVVELDRVSGLFSEVIEREQQLISQYNTYKSLHGLNAMPGGTGSWVYANRSVTVEGEVRDQWIEKLRAALVEKPKSDAHRAALSIAAKTQKWCCDGCDMVSNGGSIGRHHTKTGHRGKHRASLLEIENDLKRRNSSTRQRNGCGNDKWQCSDCDMITNGAMMARHQRARNHFGRTPAPWAFAS